MKRPTNHVTRRQAERITGTGTNSTPLPTLSMSDIRLLERLFPPRCKDVAETEGDHQRYAGKVELIAQLKAYARMDSFEDWRRDDPEDEEQALDEATLEEAAKQARQWLGPTPPTKVDLGLDDELGDDEEADLLDLEEEP